MIKLIALIASIAGGVLIIVTYNKNFITQAIGRGFLNSATYGTYMILAGWIVGLVGWFKK
jgi:hypothetical protein